MSDREELEFEAEYERQIEAYERGPLTWNAGWIRSNPGIAPHEEFVLYTDHVAAIEEAEKRGFTDGMTWRIGGPSAVEYWTAQGVSDERARIKEAVALLMTMDGEFKRSVLNAIDGEGTA